MRGGSENTYGKVNILLQAYISGAMVSSFSLISDMAYVAQNAARILRSKNNEKAKRKRTKNKERKKEKRVRSIEKLGECDPCI